MASRRVRRDHLLLKVLILLALFVPVSSQAEDIRILSLTFQEEGADSGTSSIDVQQDSDCDNVATTNDPEPFGDTKALFTLRNTLSEDLTFKRVQFVLSISGQRRRSKSLPLIGVGRAPAESDGFNGETQLAAFLLETREGKKYLAGTNTLVPTDLGARVLRIVLRGRSARGKSVLLRARSALAFGEYDRCS
jgi:hypothetical protein